MNNFIVESAELVDQDPSEITPETPFKDLRNWDSLAALSFLALCEDTYGKTVTDDDLGRAETVNDLYALTGSGSA